MSACTHLHGIGAHERSCALLTGVFASCRDGRTPLHIAVDRKQASMPVVSMLLKKRADVNAKNWSVWGSGEVSG